jgi:streptogramin lyase
MVGSALYDSCRIGHVSPSGKVTEFTFDDQYCYGGAPTAGFDGDLYFPVPIDQTKNRLARLTPNGALTVFTSLPGYLPFINLVLAPDHNVWFTERAADGHEYFARISPTGDIANFPMPVGTLDGRLLNGPDDNLLFVGARSDGQGVLDRISLDGTVYVTSFPNPVPAFPKPPVYGHVEAAVLGPDDNVWVPWLTQPQQQVLHCTMVRITPAGATAVFALPLTASEGSIFPFNLAAGSHDTIWFAVSSISDGSPEIQIGVINLAP